MIEGFALCLFSSVTQSSSLSTFSKSTTLHPHLIHLNSESQSLSQFCSTFVLVNEIALISGTKHSLVEERLILAPDFQRIQFMMS